jgi:hypothetical protein
LLANISGLHELPADHCRQEAAMSDFKGPENQPRRPYTAPAATLGAGADAPDETAGPASNLLPATNVHPAVAIATVGCYVWILFVAWLVFDHGTTMLDLVVSSFIFLIALGLPLLCVVIARNMTPERQTRRTLDAFLHGKVDTYTGRVPARTAMIEILVAPVALAVVATGICLIANAWSF